MHVTNTKYITSPARTRLHSKRPTRENSPATYTNRRRAGEDSPQPYSLSADNTPRFSIECVLYRMCSLYLSADNTPRCACAVYIYCVCMLPTYETYVPTYI